MNSQHPDDHEDKTVVGFEVPKSPDSSYDNEYSAVEEEIIEPPPVPEQLQNPLLGITGSTELPSEPHSSILNHLFIEKRETPSSVVALGFSHRFRDKHVTMVLYTPAKRRGGRGTNV